MATYKPEFDTLPAAGDLSANQYLIHKVNTSAQLEIAGAGEGGYSLQNKPDAAGKAAVYARGGTAKVKAGDVVAAGALLEVDASGRVITWATGQVVGKAIEASTAANQIIEMIVMPVHVISA